MDELRLPQGEGRGGTMKESIRKLTEDAGALPDVIADYKSAIAKRHGVTRWEASRLLAYVLTRSVTDQHIMSAVAYALEDPE